ncbi:dihydropteroate synthase [Halalkalibacter akibai]|uniref:Dihydropteroate synthase n=1 Tax=Halalkalibacter akibai (strain ATCC 43226 / DSM 21942 / CIP 109018 / JCM 9157 / 1139) TaxID=1236973 RepID=W4R168_HALA3|nr:dihydropteroate synthase [Halalkalibacter akibai]GAE37299.1 dihydropteroate synthase [Halalkalibacter akibai JCM 9157]
MNEGNARNEQLFQKLRQKTVIMGILNVTPDSFSDGGKFDAVELAVSRAKQLVEEGADIIDIGGESTRPGAVMVEATEELRRVIPVIKAVANEVKVPISIDTYKSEVAEQAVMAGASILNDVWGAKWDRKMAEVAVKFDIPIILMHNRDNHAYSNLIEDIKADLNESISICLDAGVPAKHIMLDPGIGFAKNYEENMEVMRHLDQIVEMGYPVLLGTSKKSIIAKTLNLPVDERMEGTGATVCYGIMKGCQMMRVHDVKEMRRMAKMTDALIRKDG